jgi:hypothetical protein
MTRLTALFALLFWTSSAYAADISGTISTTLTISDDSKLVGDVTCTVTDAPCIAVGAPGITLDLNGFTMTGLADAQTGCNGVPTTLVLTSPDEDGINVTGQTGVIIRGPGLVRQFRRVGILLVSSNGVAVTGVTVSTTCTAGILLGGGSSGNDVSGNVSARSGNLNFPCGGI